MTDVLSLFHLLSCSSIARAFLNQKKSFLPPLDIKGEGFYSYYWTKEWFFEEPKVKHWKILSGYIWKMPHVCFLQVAGAIHQKTNKNRGPHSLDTCIHFSYSRIFCVAADLLILLMRSRAALGKNARPD